MHRNRHSKRGGVLMLALALLPHGARPDGAMFPRRSLWQQERERSLINEPAQKAALIYRDGRERLIISPSYEGPPGDFAWVVPVPARPQVNILKGALFHELAQIVEPAPPAVRSEFRPQSAPAPGGAPPPVTVLERKNVGAYDVSVLSARDGAALATWLNRNGYLLPSVAKHPLAGYVREHWTFVACRVRVPGTARGLQTGTLAPLSLTFLTPNIVYPMRLSAVNPRPFRLLLYLVCSRGAGIPQPQAWPGRHSPRTQAAAVPSVVSGFPTLAGLGLKTTSIHWMRAIVAPQDCTHDYVWKPLTAPPFSERPSRDFRPAKTRHAHP